jgi:hypothetical protein
VEIWIRCAIGLALGFALLLAYIKGRESTFAVAFPVLVIWKFLAVLRDRNNHWLGFTGERLVGEYLNQLQRDGCYVFHDFPAAPTWNIDHIVVAPSGVYAVETKTRRKRKAPPGKEDHKLQYDGRMLHFPHCSDQHGLAQAKANATWLAKHLSKSLEERIHVTPILTFPGWFIELKAPPQFPILAPKQIKSQILSGPRRLDEKLMARIAYQLEQRCRDVEF